MNWVVVRGRRSRATAQNSRNLRPYAAVKLSLHDHPYSAAGANHDLTHRCYPCAEANLHRKSVSRANSQPLVGQRNHL